MGISKAGISNEDGFTILEFVFVVLVLGIILGLALPRLYPRFASNSLRVSSARLINAVKRLRTYAVANGLPVQLRLNLPEGKWKVEAMDAGGKWLPLAGSPVADGVLPPGILLREARSAGRGEIVQGELSLRFFPTGETARTFLYLQGEENQERTLEIHPFLNRVIIHYGRATNTPKP